MSSEGHPECHRTSVTLKVGEWFCSCSERGCLNTSQWACRVGLPDYATNSSQSHRSYFPLHLSNQPSEPDGMCLQKNMSSDWTKNVDPKYRLLSRYYLNYKTFCPTVLFILDILIRRTTASYNHQDRNSHTKILPTTKDVLQDEGHKPRHSGTCHNLPLSGNEDEGLVRCYTRCQLNSTGSMRRGDAGYP